MFRSSILSDRMSTFSFNTAMFADDCSVLFNNKTDIVRGAALIRVRLTRFGLIMHVGTDDKKSKTEAVFFPGRRTQRFQQVQETPDTAPLPENIPLPDGSHIHYSREICYLGSIISHDLKDDKEIAKRIRTASNQMGALSNFFR